MAAKGEWNIPNYELEKLAHYFLELIASKTRTKVMTKIRITRHKNKAGILTTS